MVIQLPVLTTANISWDPNPMRVRIMMVVEREEIVVSFSHTPFVKRNPSFHEVQVDDEQVFQLEISQVERNRRG
jgi:hypothetical protein